MLEKVFFSKKSRENQTPSCKPHVSNSQKCLQGTIEELKEINLLFLARSFTKMAGKRD